MEKQLLDFIYMKYGKFLSVLPGHFIKHKPQLLLLKSECATVHTVYCIPNFDLLGALKLAYAYFSIAIFT